MDRLTGANQIRGRRRIEAYQALREPAGWTSPTATGRVDFAETFRSGENGLPLSRQTYFLTRPS